MVFRSPLRPSSPPDAKAFTICSSYLDLPYFFTLPLVCQRSNSKTQSFRFESGIIIGGGERDRTDDLLRARQALSHLSYTPNFISNTPLPICTPYHTPDDLVGLGRFELPTSRLSGVRSNQLSYRPFSGFSD